MLLLVRLASLLIIVVTWFDSMVGVPKLGLISRRNQVRRQAALAYQAGRFQEALTHYRYLVQSNPSPLMGEHVNLGHVYFRLNQYAFAKRQYELGGAEATPTLLAVAAAQLGLLACMSNDTVSALGHFRDALLNDPNNEVARQNFELLKLRFSGKQLPKQPVRQTVQPKPLPEAMAGQQVAKTEQQQDRLNRLRNTT